MRSVLSTQCCCCPRSPSGYTQDPTGAMPCTPMTTPAVVYVILRAQQACSQDLIDSVRTSLLNFLTNPNTAFGECLD
jgi:hypothetical protein